ncbi:MAG TPA: DNA primase [Phycisphaerales bacterium]|nr:DNA primase [Phycisphaerales bacterium]
MNPSGSNHGARRGAAQDGAPRGPESGRGGPAGISDIERVRDAADIVRIVGEHVSLKARGREYVGLCPFHDDHSPSMCVVPHKQIFHCFVCGAGGDVFTFIEKYHRMEFREALEHLAERCNVTLTPRAAQGRLGDGAGAAEHPRSSLAQANAQGAAFFRAILQHEQHGRAARAVIERRGISAEMVERFTLGAAPDRWDGLVAKVDSVRGDRSLFVGAGLLKKREDGGHYDVFRNRLIFPIRDQIGRVIAFGGRRIDDAEEPKYLNSPETPLFNKSASLFGLHQAVQAIQRERTAIITEGYTDVIACHQAGFENVVATLGTALTPGHAAILRRLCDTVVLLFDGDDAGRRAADRAVEVFFSEPVDVRIATLGSFTEAKDPDELLKREGGAEVFRRTLAGSVDILEYRFRTLRERLAGAGVTALQRGTTEELANLARLGFHKSIPIRQKLIARKLVEITGLDSGVLYEQLRQARPRGGAAAGPGNAEPAGVDEPADAAHLVEALGCVLTDAALWTALSEEDRAVLSAGAYRSPTMRAIADAVQLVAESGRAPSLTNVLGALEGGEAKSRAVALQTRVEMIAEQRVAATLEKCLSEERRSRRVAATTAPAAADEFAAFRSAVARQKVDQQFGYDPRRAFRSSP